MLDAAEKCGVVDRKGSWYSKGDTRLAQGKAATVQLMKENASLSEEMSKAVRNILSDKKITPADPVFSDDISSLDELNELYEPDFMKE